MTPEQIRTKAIITSEDGTALPTLAQNLAFESTVAADVALAILASARKDIAAAGPAASDFSPSAQADGGGFLSYAADGLGLGTAQPILNATAAADGWKRAVAAANASIGC